MLDGDFARAWRISDAVMAERKGKSCSGLPHHLRWVWDGTPLGGRRVLIRCYHGLGDTLQFVRFVPLVAREAASVCVEAQPELFALLRSVDGITSLIPIDGAPPPSDVQIESMELPHAFRVTLATLPRDVPYLAPPPSALAACERRLPLGKLRVGVVWASGNWRRERSLPIDFLRLLATLPIELVSLQQGSARAVAQNSWFAAQIPPNMPLTVTAALMQQLDLIVSVDTMAAHLAGALARPVWVLLDSDSDWRWLRGRSDSPWYPTMRLFRQERAGAWEPVVRGVVRELGELAAVRSGTTPAVPSF